MTSAPKHTKTGATHHQIAEWTPVSSSGQGPAPSTLTLTVPNQAPPEHAHPTKGWHRSHPTPVLLAPPALMTSTPSVPPVLTPLAPVFPGVLPPAVKSSRGPWQGHLCSQPLVPQGASVGVSLGKQWFDERSELPRCDSYHPRITF
jgi:hypothetical protein